MAGSGFETPEMGIGRLLSEGNRFFVPHHQRDYSWTEDEIEQFFTDITDAHSTSQKEYFIGLMVFMPKGEREYTILDGQQRIATTMILLASIRTWLRQRGFDEDADQIQNDYIAVRELGEKNLEPRLVMNEKNETVFNDYIIQESPSQDVVVALQKIRKYEPNRRLLESILFCREKIDQFLNDTPKVEDQARRLFDLVKFFQNNVKVVRLSVPNESNAYTVFETLNDRGLDLSILDLVKNYLFGKANQAARLHEVETHWTQMMTNLMNVRADDFLKAYWTSRHGRIQTAQLFQSFKTTVDSWQKVSVNSMDMLHASEQYAALEIADDPVWVIPEKSKKRIRALRLLGARQTHPVLLSALDKFESRELERLLHLLEVLIVRYQLIGGGRTGRLEISCANLAVKIYKEEIKTATNALGLLKEIFPTDKEFQEAFATKQERNNRKAHYILETLESQIRRADGKSGEFELSRLLTVEHILPKNPSAAWEPVLKKDQNLAEDGTYRLGNLCLLTEINRDLAARSFEEKRKAFAKSSILLTKQVGEYSSWERNAIEKRQEGMAKLAVAAWRFQ
jgi:ASC-1-like (ASCH) protein